MRDIALTLIFIPLLVRIFVRPEWGAYVWAWVSVMNPHKLAYGFANQAPFAMVTAIVTMIAFLASKSRKALPLNGVTITYILLIIWMSITSLASINDPVFVTERWLFVMKIHLMMFVTLMLLRGRAQIETLMWVVTLSIAFFGVKGGIWTIVTGGGGRVWGPPGGMLAGNNELAVGLIMTVPFLYYLYMTNRHRIVRWGLLASMVFIAFSVLGTQSRGALLGLLAMTFFLGLKSRHPIRTSLAVGAAVMLVIAFMPETWTTRMDTIQSYQADTSAMSRIYTWQTMWNLAVDRPLVGGGFGTDNLALFSRYAPVAPEYQVFLGKVWVAHSIYFQALGEHGFVGLFLFITLLLGTWVMAGRLGKRTRNDPEFSKWVPLMMRMAQVSLVGYGAGGAFLSLMHVDLAYYIIGFVVLAHATVRETEKARAKAAAQVQPGTPDVPAGPGLAPGAQPLGQPSMQQPRPLGPGEGSGSTPGGPGGRPGAMGPSGATGAGR